MFAENLPANFHIHHPKATPPPAEGKSRRNSGELGIEKEEGDGGDGRQGEAFFPSIH
jgi:hypothetical protein